MKKDYGIKINGVMMFVDKLTVRNCDNEKLGTWKTVTGWNNDNYIFYFDCDYHKLTYTGKSEDKTCTFFKLDRI